MDFLYMLLLESRERQTLVKSIACRGEQPLASSPQRSLCNAVQAQERDDALGYLSI